MLGVERHIWQLGGLARTSELYARGFWQSLLQVSKQYGTVIHVCRGWWAALDTPEIAIEARRAGGRLACVSALELYGEAGPDLRLHVALERSTRKPRGKYIVPNWSREELPGTRLAVSVEIAREQAARCAYNQSRFLNET